MQKGSTGYQSKTYGYYQVAIRAKGTKWLSGQNGQTGYQNKRYKLAIRGKGTNYLDKMDEMVIRGKGTN